MDNTTGTAVRSTGHVVMCVFHDFTTEIISKLVLKNFISSTTTSSNSSS